MEVVDAVAMDVPIVKYVEDTYRFCPSKLICAHSSLTAYTSTVVPSVNLPTMEDVVDESDRTFKMGVLTVPSDVAAYDWSGVSVLRIVPETIVATPNRESVDFNMLPLSDERE